MRLNHYYAILLARSAQSWRFGNGYSQLVHIASEFSRLRLGDNRIVASAWRNQQCASVSFPHDILSTYPRGTLETRAQRRNPFSGPGFFV